MNSSETIREELLESGSVSINDTIHIQNGPRAYRVSIAGKSSRPRLLKKETAPSSQEIQTYIDAIQTVSSWNNSGYHSVNGWDYTETRTSKHDWRTGSDNYVRISTRGDTLSFTSSITAKLFMDSDLLQGSRHNKKVKLSAAIFLHSISPDMFDYLYDKYQSMYQNLTEVRGIGDKVATQLLDDRECTTYREAKNNLYQTNIPHRYVSDAKNELEERHKNHPKPLVDPQVKIDHSTVIMANEI